MKIIKITAMWCPSCLIMNDTIKEIINEYCDVELVEYDFDLDQDMVEKYNVGTILPVLIKLDDSDNEIGRINGEHTKKEIIDFIKG